MKTHLMVGIAMAVMMIGAFAVNAQDKAVEAIVKKNQTEVKRSNDAAIKALTNLITTRTRSKDTEGVARCQQAIAQITGEDVEEVADNAAPGGRTFPEGTFKWKGNHYYVFPKTKWANYEEAEAACKELGGHVLRISSKKEFEYFTEYRTKELKLNIRIVLEKLDITVKDEQFEQTKYVRTREGPAGQYKSSNINYMAMDIWGNGAVCYAAVGNYSDEMFVICEWEK
jgi:hypothetical protein